MAEEVLCGLWTEHRINSRDEGFKDYRDSHPVGALLCPLNPGMQITETSPEGDPSAHVLRYTGEYEYLKVEYRAINHGWEKWLEKWKLNTARKETL